MGIARAEEVASVARPRVAVRAETRTLQSAAVIFAAAFTARFAWAWIADIPMRAAFRFDPSMYDIIARNIAEGRGYYFLDTTAYFPPLYPTLLAGFYRIFGAELAGVWAMNAALGGVGAALTYLLGRAVSNERAGRLAGFIAAITPGDVFYSAMSFTEPLFVTMMAGLLLAFVMLERRQAGLGDWALFGLACGLAALTRGVALFWLLAPLIAWWRDDGFAKAAQRTAVVVAVVALVALPWAIRNYVVFNHFPLLSIDGPYALLNSHNEVADGSQRLGIRDIRTETWPEIMAMPNGGRRDVELARVSVPYAITYAVEHPAHEAWMIPRRLYYMAWHDHEAFNFSRTKVETEKWPVVFDRDTDALVTGIADAWFFALLIFAAVGLYHFNGKARGSMILPAALIAFAVIHGLLFFGDPRFHAPFMPVLAVLGALGFTEAFRRGSHLNSRHHVDLGDAARRPSATRTA